MNLHACSDCGHRFYTPGDGATKERRCPRCGGALALSLHGLRSIPLDARWLDARVEAGNPNATAIASKGVS